MLPLDKADIIKFRKSSTSISVLRIFEGFFNIARYGISPESGSYLLKSDRILNIGRHRDPPRWRFALSGCSCYN